MLEAINANQEVRAASCLQLFLCVPGAELVVCSAQYSLRARQSFWGRRPCPLGVRRV